MGQKKIGKLLEQVKEQELVLPEFQREFTWSRDQTKELMRSLYNQYPTGSLLVWNLNVDKARVSKKLKFKNDAVDLERIKSIDVLLDGQQRLTTLYIYCYDDSPPFYQQKEIPDKIWDLYFNIYNGDFKYYKASEMKNNPYWLPVPEIFEEKPNLYDLLNRMDKDGDMELLQRLDGNVDRLRQIPDQFYPIQSVPTGCGLGEAVEVFDLINSQGTPLTKADIALAHMTESWPTIRRKFKNKIFQLEEENFQLDLTFMTRCMNGIVKGHAEFEHIHKSSEEELREGWEKLTDTLDYLVGLLKNTGYIYTTGDLSSTNVLVPLVVYLSKKKPNKREIDKLLYWLYGALFQRRYSSQTDQKLEDDISSLEEELSPTVLIENLKEEEGEPEVSPKTLDMRGVRHPLYNMMTIAARKDGAVDWDNGLKLRETIGKNYSIQKHHIFPRSVLTDNGYDTGKSQSDKKRVNEIANRVPLTKSGNLEIFAKPPSKYLPVVREKYPGALESLFVPLNEELWKVENYEEFLEERRRLIVRGINQYMESLIETGDTNEIDVEKLIEKEENQTLEFKSTLRFDLHRNQVNKDLEKVVAKTVNGFLNAEGGILLIGVDDSGNPVGLQKDYKTLHKSRDGFQNHLTQVLENYLGVENLHLINLYIENINGKDICVVQVEEASTGIYLQTDGNEEFYVRHGNSTRPYSMSEAQDYIEKKYK